MAYVSIQLPMEREMPLQPKILVGGKAAAPLAVTIDDKNGLCSQAGEIENHGVIAAMGNARQQAGHHLRIGLVDVRPDERQRLVPGIIVPPDVDIVHSRMPERNGAVLCSPLADPSRYQRRRHYQSAHTAPRNLGVIEGERLSRARGYHDAYGMAKALASLAAVTAFLLLAAIVFGAL